MAQKPWSAGKAASWHKSQPWPVGCNFIPSNCINQLDMWQAGTFDPGKIGLELGWAAKLGFNAVRVYLHDLVYDADPAGFKDRLRQYLAAADGLHIRTILVFFDDCWNATFKLGRQPAPEPHLHNSHWAQSPGLAQLERFTRDDKLRQRLEIYVKDILTTFASDQRVLLWDLYNEPGGWMKEPGREELVGERCLPLLEAVFGWARDIAPSQPVSSGLFNGDYRKGKPGSVSRTQIENSDIVTFHNYGSPDSMEADIRILTELSGRPMICTEYLARPGCTFQGILPVLKKHNVGAVNWGLAAGKTQTIYPWDSWKQPHTKEPELWHHDILRPDGSAYDGSEVAFLRSMTGKTGPAR